MRNALSLNLPCILLSVEKSIIGNGIEKGFICIVLKELGYFSWDISNPGKEKYGKHNINKLEWKDLLKRLDIEAKPKELTNITDLNSNLSTKEDFRLSDKFLNKRKNQVIIFWLYPYNLPPSIPCNGPKIGWGKYHKSKNCYREKWLPG